MFAELLGKLRKYPTATAAVVFAAVFSIVLSYPACFENSDFLPLWMVSFLTAVHIWNHFKVDKTYRVSGIVPAWIELAAGFVLLFRCPVREVSLVLVMLAVCSYTAGIIFSFKMAVPMALYLLAAPYIAFCSALLLKTAAYFTPWAGGAPPDTGTVHLFWWTFLVTFSIASLIFKSSVSRIWSWIGAIPIYILCDMTRRYLVSRYEWPKQHLLVMFLAALAVISGLFYLIQKFCRRREIQAGKAAR